MKNFYHKYYLPLILFVFLFLSFSPLKLDAATCVLQSATWNKSRAGQGEVVNFTVNGTGCETFGLAIKIWEKDLGRGASFDPDDLVKNYTKNFPTSSSVLTDSWAVDLS